MDNQSVRTVSTEAGLELAKKSGAIFGEVSAKTGEGIDEVRLYCIVSQLCYMQCYRYFRSMSHSL